jgi:DNA-binding IclR family transcriptional regulator
MSFKELRREEIEDAIGGKGRLRILGLLSENKERFLTKYAIKKETGLRARTVKSDLLKLVRLGWVRESPHEPKKYRINLEKEEVEHTVEFLHKIRYV